MPLFEWSDKPATKKDLITHLVTLGVAMWLVDSGTGEKGLEQLQAKVRGLLGAASDKPKDESQQEPSK